MVYHIVVRQGNRNGPIYGDKGPFATQALARQMAATEAAIWPPGYVVTVEERQPKIQKKVKSGKAERPLGNPQELTARGKKTVRQVAPSKEVEALKKQVASLKKKVSAKENPRYTIEEAAAVLQAGGYPRARSRVGQAIIDSAHDLIEKRSKAPKKKSSAKKASPKGDKAKKSKATPAPTTRKKAATKQKAAPEQATRPRTKGGRWAKLGSR